MREWHYLITDKEGLHARPAAQLMMLAKTFQSEIRGEFNGRFADLKSVIETLGLGAVCGDQVCIRAVGPDEEEAIDAIRQLLEP